VLTDLTPDQRALAEYMSELSEQAICAGWIGNLEHALWRARIEGPFVYSRLVMTDEHIAKLTELSERCGGWIVYEPRKEETFVPMEKWTTEMYDRKCAL
jgi:hypothetical protein